MRGNEAELTLRAATSLEVQVTTETHDRYRPFYTQGVLYRGEPRQYTIPLTANHKAIVISWRDALGNAGIRVLDQNSIPYPLPGLETADCGLSMTEVGWRLGNVTGRLSSACNSRAEEVVEATVLTDPADPAAVVSRKLLLDADVADVTGEVYLAASAAGSTTGLAFARDGDMPFNFSLPQEDRVHQVSLRADITSTRVIPLPGRVDLTHNEEQSLIERIPVIGYFAGFYHTVSSTLSAWFGPVVHTVSATLSAWFGPVVRTLSATLSAAWGAVTHTVGGWISATVGKWLSAIHPRRRCSRRPPARKRPASAACPPCWPAPARRQGRGDGRRVPSGPGAGRGWPAGAGRHWPPGGGHQRRCGSGRDCSVAASIG